MTKKAPSKPGRHAKPIDCKRVIELASNGCTVREIAALEDCSESLIGHKYAEALKRGRELLTASLRRKQVDVALTGNPTMLIWLGKNLLEQSDKQELEVSGGISIISEIPRPQREQ